MNKKAGASQMGASNRAKYMIETSEVAELIERADPKLRLINASWYKPGSDTVIDPNVQHEENRLTQQT